MELPQVGKQCTVSDCKQLDFLPFECDCKLCFCREHFMQHIGKCTSKPKIDNVDKLVTFTSYKCSEPECSEKSVVPLICEKCNRHYCVKHRHITGCEKVDEQKLQEAIDKCNAPKLQFQKAKNIADKEVEHNIQNAKRKEKNVKTANKVQLMRLKSKATGLKTIPTTDRLYFLIINEKYCKEGKAVFISRDWTVGRCIDAISEECTIPNNNNKLSASKLRLFKKEDNQILSSTMSDKIDIFIHNSDIVNGDSLILDYVNA